MDAILKTLFSEEEQEVYGFAFLVPLSLVLWSPKIIHLPNQLLLLMFIFHYLQRSLIYLIRGGNSTPFISFVLAFVFCIYNGYLQGLVCGSWDASLIFTLTIYSGTGYEIPRGGMFEYVSLVRLWNGLDLLWPVTRSIVQLLLSSLSLCCPAEECHKWNLTKFEDYPKSRKA